MRSAAVSVLTGLCKGWQGSSTSASSYSQLLQVSAAASGVQWQHLPQVCNAELSGWLSQLQAQRQQQSITSLSHPPAAVMQHPSTARPLPAASLQQCTQQQYSLPLPWRNTQHPMSQLCAPQLQLQSGQQVRHFVLMPRNPKYRKAHKGMGFNEVVCGNTRQLAFGLYGIRAMEHCRMPARTLETIRQTLRRTIKKTTMLWIRVTPNVPVTSKPAEVRMGKGKGTLDYWAAPIRPGQIIFEMDRCNRNTALQAMKAIQPKMPIKIGFVEWN